MVKLRIRPSCQLWYGSVFGVSSNSINLTSFICLCNGSFGHQGSHDDNDYDLKWGREGWPPKDYVLHENFWSTLFLVALLTSNVKFLNNIIFGSLIDIKCPSFSSNIMQSFQGVGVRTMMIVLIHRGVQNWANVDYVICARSLREVGKSQKLT